MECLEKELDALDQWDMSCGVSKRLKCLECRDRDRKQSTLETMSAEFKQVGFKRTRPEVMTDLKSKLMDYDEILLKTKAVNALARPSGRDQRSVVNWFESKTPLVESEARYIYRKQDLVTLRTGRECGRLAGVVEACLSSLDRVFQIFNCDIIKVLFISPELRDKTTDGRLHYYSSSRVDVLVNLIVSGIMFVLLILPVVVLFKLSNRDTSPLEAIGILIVFTLVFGAAMSSLTTATRQELFAAAAAYCALLVVFLSNFTTQTVKIL